MNPTSRLLRGRRPASSVRATFAIVAALAVSSGGESRLFAQERPAGLRVVVIAAGTDLVVAGAVVRIDGSGIVGRTGPEGDVRLDGIAAGAHVVSVEAPGFVPARSLFTFEAGTVLATTVPLEPDPIPLANVDVDAPRRSRWLEMAGFYERAEDGMGTFLAPEEIEERAGRAARLSDMLRAVPGLRVVQNGAVPGTYVVESRRGSVSFRQPCRPAFWIDGVPLGIPVNLRIDAIAHPAEILAMEIYDGPADLPSAFKAAGGACGAVLLWTGEHRR